MKQAASTRLYRRLQAVLLAGDGHSATQIAAITGTSLRSVQNWCAAWRHSPRCRHPQQALAEQPRLGRRPGLAGLDRASLLAELAQDPLSLGYAATNWTAPLLATYLQRQGWPISPRTLRAAWALRGQQAEVRLSGKNARRSPFGAIDLRTRRRVLRASHHQRIGDFQRFLRRLRHGVGACGPLWLLLDRHRRHCSPSRLRLAVQLDIRLLWLPRQCPKLNPVDHLWRGLKR